MLVGSAFERVSQEVVFAVFSCVLAVQPRNTCDEHVTSAMPAHASWKAPEGTVE
ncbi:hypothetical protein PF006_g9602 [Phytophthora fragariae]|uniref:Uncharacterized protein n=1 Tax=Phytophthora fragariae TaxID=53985 RepID=A0A6A3U3H5_9STRA|nr:hypothetical protein PF006_g9602 [Phytophthora fragariae]